MYLESSAWNSTACLLTWNVSTTPAKRLLFRLVPWTPATEGIESGLSPTPMVGSTNAAAHNQISGRFREAMAKKMALWPTPRASENGQNLHFPEKGYALSAIVKLFPIPGASEARQGLQIRRPGKKGTQQSLTTIVKLYPTMDVGAAKGGGEKSAENRSRLGGSLNPNWVEWLMGYPIGHTACDDLATPSSRKSRKC
jgi:DNA (cytosine-5)-methyltransferase 1